MKELVAYVDGASRGNPGQSGAGVVIKDSTGAVIKNINKYIGVGTNNTAEYNALLLALDELSKLGADKVRVFLDSELVYKQFLGEYRTKDENLKELLKKAREKQKIFQSFEIFHIPREENKEADRLANVAINIGETGGG